MAKKYSTIQQHEPLRPPSNWGAHEKKFVAQLEEILDDIFRRFGRLKISDLGDALRQSLSDTEGNVSELKQTATAHTTAFESIGTMGKQTGITKVTEKGVEVQHSAINTTTKMNADGFKVYDANGNEIGGLVVIDGKVYLASQALMNPSTPTFRIGVVDKDFEGEQMGLHWIFDGAEAGAISAHSGGMRHDVEGDLSLYPSNRFHVNADKGFSITTANGAGLYVYEDGYTEIHFQRYGSDGVPYIDRISMEYIADGIDSLSSD